MSADTIASGERTAMQEWRSGWLLALSASVGFSFFSILLAATGLFMGPLGEEFGWSRAFLSSGASISTLVTALLGPFLGAMIDRFGARRVALPGIVLVIASISSFSLLDGSQWMWIALWLVFGAVAVTIKSTVWTAAVVGVFEKSRGLALGVTLAGTAVAQMIVPPLGNYLITEFGWRYAFIYLALGWGGLTLLLCWLFFFDIRARAERASKSAADAAQKAAQTLHLPGLTIPEAFRSITLWKLAVSNFIVMVLTIGLAVHLFPILTDAGVSRERAAWLVSLSGLAGIIGKFVTGWMLDRYRPNWTGGLTLGAAALAFCTLIGTPPLWVIIVAMLVNGYAAGAKTHITGFLTAGYGGMKNFGAIYGFMSSLLTLAAGLGPFIAGLLYDRSGNYTEFLIAGTIGCAIGGLLIVSMPRYPEWDRARGEKA